MAREKIDEAVPPTQEELLALWEHTTSFVVANRVWSAEAVYQVDRVIENSYEFVAGACDIVGYLPHAPEDDE